MKRTSTYGFIKPELHDHYRVDDQNTNWDELEKILNKNKKRTACLWAVQFFAVVILFWMRNTELHRPMH